MNRPQNVKLNMLINGAKGLLSVLFPLISFPYISRVLQVDNIGRFNFANSVVSYFVLIASLGIGTYAACEGAKHRENREDVSRFASEVFSVNVISTALSYLLLVGCLLCVDKFQEYTALILVLSVQIAFQTLGKEWICSIFEDYTYVAIRYVIFQILSLAALFLFVRDSGDCLIYAAVVVMSMTGANVVNFFRVRKFCDIHLVFDKEILRHIKPILVFFATSIAITIYVNSDVIILGFLTSDRDVGIYSVSVKVYTIIKSVLGSAVAVTVPRMAALSAQSDRTILGNTAKEIYEIILTIVLPALVGVMVLSEEIIWIVAGDAYAEASTSLRILALALLFSMLGYFWGECVLYSFRKESVVLKGTILSAIVNVCLNFLWIPLWSHNAAALTTVLSEGLSAAIFAACGRKCLPIQGHVALIVKVGAGCTGIFLVDSLIRRLSMPLPFQVCITILASVAVYFLIELILKNHAVTSVFSAVQNRIRK